MPFNPFLPIEKCPLCGEDSNKTNENNALDVVDCSLCGDFRIAPETEFKVDCFPLTDPKKIALVRYSLRKLQRQAGHPYLDLNFFTTLDGARLPTPAEACDNAIKWFAKEADYRPGPVIQCPWSDVVVFAEIGVVNDEELQWVFNALKGRRLLLESAVYSRGYHGLLSAEGWERFEELQRAHVASTYAFFARQFVNTDLDKVYEDCLRPAVQQTGFQLRTVTQRAGHIDAIIEDEIRRCKFLIADLSDDNAGAYWEAGFAEGLGKPVIYLCQQTVDGEEKKTHFDTDHRHTVRWDLSSLDETAKQLKAVIRNTLLGEAKQDD